MFISKYLSPIGEITMTSSDGECLEGLWIDGQTNYLECLIRRGEDFSYSEKGIFHDIARWLDSYFAGGRSSIGELKLKLIGSNFRLEVWRILCGIPYGETVTYGEIARIIAERRWLEMTGNESNKSNRVNNDYKANLLNNNNLKVSNGAFNNTVSTDSDVCIDAEKSNKLSDTAFMDKSILIQHSESADCLPLRISAQAVGGAVGHNPISIIIPCHRVVGKNGNLVGYGGGIELKKKLLALEGIDLTKFHDPRNT